jgi:hypothetical protein
VCRTSPGFKRGQSLRPAGLRHWPTTGGPETLLRLDDGQFMIIAERARDDGPVRPLLLFDRDPADRGAGVTYLGYRPSAGFSPTDAAQLPDGRILILERSFRLLTLFTAQLVIIDPESLQPGSIVQGRIVARFAKPATPENFEGIDVSSEAGRTIVWIISDDNFASWQRTLLLKFAWDDPVD